MAIYQIDYCADQVLNQGINACIPNSIMSGSAHPERQCDLAVVTGALAAGTDPKTVASHFPGVEITFQSCSDFPQGSLTSQACMAMQTCMKRPNS
jgi:hypothetical protein